MNAISAASCEITPGKCGLSPVVMSGNRAGVGLRYLGGPTALLELGGLRLLTDPTFDPPGDYHVFLYHVFLLDEALPADLS